MGSTNPQIKNFITIAYDYLRSKTDKNLIQLQRHLQILSVVNELRIFEPTSMETLEFYMCLEKFLEPSQPSSPVAWKVITLLSHISQSKTICNALRDDIKIVPVLSEYYLNSKLSKDKQLKTLNLIEKLSYRLKVVRAEAWVLKMVPELVRLGTDGNLGDDLLLPALKTLVNLCRANPPVLQCLHTVHNKKALVHKLTDMKIATINIRLLATELMFYMNSLIPIVDAELMEYILDTIFTATTDGLIESNISLLQHSADVFGELISHSRIEEHLRVYEKYGAYVERVANGLVPEMPEELVEPIMDLLCHLLHLDHPHIHPFYDCLFSKSVTWMESEVCGVAAVKVVQSLVDKGDGTVSSAHMNCIISVLKVTLKPDDEVMSAGQLHHIIAVLNLLEGLCQRDVALHLMLAVDLPPSIFSLLLNRIMNIDSMLPNGVADSACSPSIEATSSSRQMMCSQRSLANISVLSVNDIKASFGEVVSQAVVMVLSVVKMLGNQNAEFMLEYSKMLNNQPVMVHLVRCQRSNSSDFVSRAVCLMTEGTIPTDSLSELVRVSEEANSSQSTNGAHPSERFYRPDALQQLFSPENEKNTELMISRLRGSVDKMEIKDSALIDVMEMYEYKLAAMAHMEDALQKALTASDVMNRQIHNFLLQTRVQNDCLRGLLCRQEERLQEVQKDKADIVAALSQVKESARQQRESFRNEKTSFERQKQELKRDVASLKEALDSRDEKIAKLQRQVSEANQESKTLHKQIKEEQDRCQKSLDANQKLEEEMKKGRREYDDLQRENQRVEKEKAQLRDEIKELEMLVRSHEDAMSAKENELEIVTKKFSELKRIQDMIHNISSGKIGNFYEPNKS